MISRVAFEAAAEQLLDKHGVTTPPVPVERIAELEGIEIVASHSAGLESGFAFRDGDRRVIGVNTRESRRRRRFTVGHEIGHLLLHERELTVDQTMRVHKRDDVSSMATNREEIEANGFAAALLMPEGLLAVAARAQLSRSTSRRLTRDDLVSALARNFDVSTEAMGYRLVNLGMLSP